jgi:hypothetical protein
VVVNGDGAAWIRTERDRHFLRATFIIDWYHAVEHLWTCGKALFGDGSLGSAQWVKKRKNGLWRGRVEKVLWNLEQHLPLYGGERRKALEDLIRYLRTHREQMRYDKFREKGYDIGSGAVEGACKHVVGKRLKGSGMIWSRKGVSSTLALRILWLNKDWEPFWRTKPLAG